MATALGYRVITSADVALVAATAKTVLSVKSPAGHGLTIVNFHVSFDGVASANVPALVEILQSTAAAGTYTAATVTQIRGRATAGTAPTGGQNASAEPTVLTLAAAYKVPVFNGLYTEQEALGREFEIDSSAGTIKELVIRVTAANVVNVRAWFECENL